MHQAVQRYLLKTEAKWINGSLPTEPEEHQSPTQLKKYSAKQWAAWQEDTDKFFSGEIKWSQKNDCRGGKNPSTLLDSVAGNAK